MYDEVAYQLALRSKLLTLSVATTGAISLAATATGYTRTASTGTVTSSLGFAEFSDSQAGKLAAGSVIVVGGVSYTLLTFNGGTLATLSDEPTFGASAFTMGFLAENFSPGMEITPAGFANNSHAVITEVSALSITAKRITGTTVNGVTTYTLGAITAEAAAGSRSLTVGLPSQRAWENDASFEPTAGIPYVREEFIPGPTEQVTIGPFGELQGWPQYAMHFNAPAGSRLTPKKYVQAARILFAPRTQITASNGDTIRVRADTGPYAGQLQTSTPGFAVQPFTVPLRVRSPNVI